tara:strand:+ start:1303 stop:1722 length:420 start_codon:yes stop_codon:yes gene_type:complete
MNYTTSNDVYKKKHIDYIDNLINVLTNIDNITTTDLNLKIINQTDNYTTTITGNITYFQYINDNTLYNIKCFIKNKFRFQTYVEIYSLIKKIINKNKYAIFIFIESKMFTIPLIIDEYNIHLEISDNNKIIFNTNEFIN